MTDRRRCVLLASLRTCFKDVEVLDEFAADSLQVLRREIPFAMDLPRSLNPERKQNAENDDHPFRGEA